MKTGHQAVAAKGLRESGRVPLPAEKKEPTARVHEPHIRTGPLAAFFGVVLVALLAAHQGKLLQLAIPLCGLTIGVLLLRRSPTGYIRYTLWAWFLTALVRRIVDDRCGFADQNLILLTPMLVAGVAGLEVARQAKRLRGVREVMPMLVCLAGFLYGFCIDLVLHPTPKLAYALLQWATPLVFGLYLCLTPERYVMYRDAVLSTLLQALLLLGAYGLYQFFVMPSWDVDWLNNVIETGTTSFGRAEPGQLRIWSTLNAPGFFAVLLVTGIVLLFFRSSRWKIPAMLLAVVNLCLTLIRTEWIGLVVALILLAFALPPRRLFRYIISLVLFCGCLPLLTLNPTINQVVQERVASLQDMGNDTSYQDRKELYESSLRVLAENPLGTDHLSEEKLDNGFIDVLLALGWPGGLAYLGGLSWILLNPSIYLRCRDPFLRSCHARAFALVITLASGNILTEMPGAILWICIALYITGDRHLRTQEAATALTPQAVYVS